MFDIEQIFDECGTDLFGIDTRIGENDQSQIVAAYDPDYAMLRYKL